MFWFRHTHLILVFKRAFFFIFLLCQVVGTYGYAAPEYVDTGHLTVNSDVYSFGVVLYEILSGRRTLERSRPTPEQKLLEWVKEYPVDSNRFSMIIDSRLRNQYPIRVARKIAKLADSCLVKNAKDRPTMGHVVEILKQALKSRRKEVLLEIWVRTHLHLCLSPQVNSHIEREFQIMQGGRHSYLGQEMLQLGWVKEGPYRRVWISGLLCGGEGKLKEICEPNLFPLFPLSFIFLHWLPSLHEFKI